MTTIVPDDAVVDDVAAEVHACECGCPPDHPDHAEHIHQNRVWVTIVLACAARLGYRTTQETTP